MSFRNDFPEVKAVELSENKQKEEGGTDEPVNAPTTSDNKLEEVLIEAGTTSYHLKIYFIIAFFLMADGSEIIVLSLLTPKLAELWDLSQTQKGLIGSSVFVGFFIGSFLSGKVSDSRGRKPAFVLGAMIVSIFAISSSLAPNYVTFIFLRATAGMGIGIAVPSAGTLASELTSSKTRSYVMNLIWIAFPIGEIYAVLVAKQVLETENGWRKLIILCATPIFIAFIMSFFIGESPKFNFAKNRSNKAISVIGKICECSSKRGPLTEEEKQQLIDQNVPKQNESTKASYGDLFSPKYRRLTLQICFIYFSCSFVYYGVTYILPQTMKEHTEKNGDTHDPHETFNGVILSALSELPNTLIAGLMANNALLGRVKTMGIGYLFTSIGCMFCFTMTHQLVFFASMVKLAIGIPFNVINLYIVEAYETKIRSTALGVSNASTRLAGIATPFISQMIFTMAHNGPFLVYTIVSAIATFACFTLPFETLGKAVK